MIPPDSYEPSIDILTAEDLSPEELRFEIAIMAGLLAHQTSSADAARDLINVATALTPGGRA